MFSSRVHGHRATNRLTLAMAEHRAAGRPVIDLTITNPTVAGIDYPPDLLRPLSAAASLTYAPDASGLRTAREAIARDYMRRGTGASTAAVDPDRILLTASTSEAYSILFKLLCEPSGDDVLVPVPSYPLFDHLAALDGVRPIAYRLEYHGRWELDAGSVDSAWTSRTRAVLAVTPNNPTGSTLSAAELRSLDARGSEREAAVIVDEVFADYAFTDDVCLIPEIRREALTFRLGGLSKSVGLPQVKLGWILVDGPEPLVHDALARLELIADTYLSVSTPVQIAAPHLLEEGLLVREAIRKRVRLNLAHLQRQVRSRPALELLHADGGWAAVIRVPARASEEDMVLALLQEHDTLVHPGFFFDFSHEAFVVLSLLPSPDTFVEGVSRVVECFDA